MSLRRVILETAVGTLLPTSPSKVIFIYHDISEINAPHHSPYYSTLPSIFKKQIDFIRNRYHIISLEDLLSKEQARSNVAAITFDDGFESVYSRAFPFLRNSKIPFTIFLNKTAIVYNQLWLSNLFIKRNDTGYLMDFFFDHHFENLNQKEFLHDPINFVKKHFEKVDLSKLISQSAGFPKVYLDEREVKYLHEHGVGIGNHTVNHTILSKVSDEIQHNEILHNKLFLENLINKRVDFLAIPFGKKSDFNEHTINLCEATGHTHFFSSNPSLVNNSDSPIPRIGLINDSVRTVKFYLKRPFFKKIDI